MKNILILGCGRAGKSTLSRLLKSKYPEYNLVHMDAIWNGFLYNIDKKYVKDFMNYQENCFFQNVLLDFLDSQTKQDSAKYGTIMAWVKWIFLI